MNWYRLLRLWVGIAIVLTSGVALSEPNAMPVPFPEELAPHHLMPPGDTFSAEVPDTLDLAERARVAVEGLTQFLDRRNDYGDFDHGFFCTNPPFMVHTNGQRQNWGKVAEALILARQMCGSDRHLEAQLQSIQGMLVYAQAKMREPYPVPLARINLSLIALNRQNPDPELVAAIRTCTNELLNKVTIDPETRSGYFGPPEERWKKDDRVLEDYGELGHWLQVFTAGTVLRSLVMADEVPGVEVDDELLLMLRNNLMDARYWQVEQHPPMVIPSDHGQFSGHIHSYTQALLGLLYYAHHAGDVRAAAFVRAGYEHTRTLGLARIGLFGEGCAVGDMTYLAVRLSQWGVGDYWDDVDQYVRNHLAELQITDAVTIQAIVDEHAMPLQNVKHEDWAQQLESEDVLNRCRGLFFSDAAHPTLIPLLFNKAPYRSCMQWVVCCTGNCSKALHVVWDSIVDFDPTTRTARIQLLLNRASDWVDVDSYLPNEGRVVIKNKQAKTLLVRIPQWADRTAVRCSCEGAPVPFVWAGNYVLMNDLEEGVEIELSFPMNESTEEFLLTWRENEFWHESNQPAANHEAFERPIKYTIRLRGNTLAQIEPRDTQVGVPLYVDRSLEKFREPASKMSVSRFVYQGRAPSGVD